MVHNRLTLDQVASNLGVMEGDPAAPCSQLDPLLITNSLALVFAVVLTQCRQGQSSGSKQFGHLDCPQTAVQEYVWEARN